MGKNNEKPIRVLHVGVSTNCRGGISTVIDNYLSAFRSGEIKVLHLVTSKNKRKFEEMFLFCLSVLKLLFLILLKRIDIVHIHVAADYSFIRKYIVFIIAKCMFGYKTIIHLHSNRFDLFYSNSNKYLKYHIKLFFECSDLVIALGTVWEKFINETFPNSNVVILNNSVVVNKTLSNRVGRDNINFLYLAKLDKRKGWRDLVLAIEQTSGKEFSACFHFAGNGESKMFKEVIKSKKLDKLCIYHGWADKNVKEKLFNESDVLILPSYNEGLPMVVLEAMSNGLPVIASDVGSTSDAVKDNYNGFLFAPGDVSTLKSKIEYFIINKEKIFEMGKNAHSTVMQSFSLERHISTLKDIYINL